MEMMVWGTISEHPWNVCVVKLNLFLGCFETRLGKNVSAKAPTI